MNNKKAECLIQLFLFHRKLAFPKNFRKKYFQSTQSHDMIKKVFAPFFQNQ